MTYADKTSSSVKATARQEKSAVAEREEKILKFWKENRIFEKSLEKKSPKGDFVFYDGPPFATGLPHYGHILPGTIKDVIPRYKTMRGYHVRRQWGWDCHGLPIENLIEKELDLKTKKDIETYGVAKFNERAQESVLRYADDWRRVIPRTGRWVDMEQDYRTMDWNYTESVWWVFKTLHDKKLIYEGFKPMHICPRCETTLSNFEVAQGYKDVTDISVIAKFELADEPHTFFLAWTTTPWTLPGNAALAIGKDFEYVKIQTKNQEGGIGSNYVLAKARLSLIKEPYEIEKEFKGKELVGKKYKPLFDYYSKDSSLKNKENGWKVYAGDFVSLEEGTGIVHIAPAFGADDMELGKKNNLPFIQHVGMDGKFRPEVKDFVGTPVKPKDNPQSADVEIIKNLFHRNLLFAKEKITHPYPHCWRCDTPLLNYAATSWFVKVSALRKKLIAANKKVSWVPKEIGKGRFEKGLETAPDWAISRSRYWGAPIPVWKNEKGDEVVSVGSLEDIKKYTPKSGNTYFLMRHGESESNAHNLISSFAENNHPLTERGVKEVQKALRALKKEKIDLIIASPFLRTKQTAGIVAKELGIDFSDTARFVLDPRLGEINLSELNGKPTGAYHDFAPTYEERFRKAPQGGESLADVKRRAGEFLYEIEKKFSNKKILIVTHEYVVWMLSAVSMGANAAETIALRKSGAEDFIKTAGVKKLPFTPLPHNAAYELDVHRPYIDTLELQGKDGAKLTRVKEVFDCWFESGSMPYGQYHHPSAGKKEFNPSKKKGFPADFIAESLDQTRGWFYSLMVLGVGLFGVSPYKNVVVSGLILGEDGQKMSKRLRNYPEVTDVLEKYGADALRFYLMSSPLVRADTINFSEKGVQEVSNKVVSRLLNVLEFYGMYGENKSPKKSQSKNVLDLWIMSRLAGVAEVVEQSLDHYELDKASREIAQFIEDFSTWYIRRSRDRFRGEDGKDRMCAVQTTRTVLLEFSKIIAPLMPFVAEEIFQNVREKKDPTSVHLTAWNFKIGKKQKNLEHLMEQVRKIVSLALEARLKAGIKVRQPLALLKIKVKNTKIKNNKGLLALIKDEVNVKEVVFDSSIPNDVELDTVITPELKKEGQVRELTRLIQDLRKEAGLAPSQKVSLAVKTNTEGLGFLKAWSGDIKKATNVKEIIVKQELSGKEYAVDGMTFIFLIQKD